MALVGVSLFVAAGCSVGANEDETAASQDELTSNAARLVGAYHVADAAIRPPTFEGIVFQADGAFFADVDTGIRCVTAPCPSHVRITGRFSAPERTITLTPSEPSADEREAELYGRYSYSLDGAKLSFAREGFDSWTNELAKETSYCAQPVDCGGQGLIVPACVGRFTCSEQRTCGWDCGAAEADTVWPSDRERLLAQTPGGGFTPPAAPGSTCALGAQRYDLDFTTRKLVWEVCSFQDWSTPLYAIRGSRQLTAAEMASIDAAMNDVAVTSEEICGADKPLLSIEVTSASQGTMKYVDSFYACMGDDMDVDNIDGVFSAFRALVPQR